jgi:hypothetical protein
MSTMKEMLKLMTADFGHSEPVYEGQVSSDGRYISFILKDPYSPNPSDYEDPVMKVLATHYRESTRNPYLGKIVFKADVNIDRCIDAMTAYIYDFYIQKSPLKNPKQSRLYKWFNTIYNDRASEGFIHLYRYIVNNVLEMMREKHEGK